MARVVTIGAAQMGPIQRSETRGQAVERMLRLLREAHRRQCDLVVFPEAALTAFFPHWYMADDVEIDSYFETSMPSNETEPLFAEARRLGIGFHLGYAELAPGAQGGKRRFNTAILVDKAGRIVSKYRKVHLPGRSGYRPEHPFQNLEKYYFQVGDLGFPVVRAFGGNVGMMICNDRRWPECYRVMGLQSVELIVLGYNTPVHNPGAPEHDSLGNFHNQLVMQAGAYQNGTYVVGVAKAGREEGIDQLGQSSIIAPSGEIMAQSTTLGDELVVAACDLDRCASYKDTIFNFAAHRRPEAYRLIVERTAAIPPAAS
ncbi:MAG: N-carbamoyl-D-amino-acid hydrolase [Alphaproteobacteria bacterium]|nr:N-carbamoyl-D-amino-acid hydrolase [Alphaproteobacteria bacterium]